eukprot:419703-Prorocentrum_minimum.AAC.2
MASPEAENIQRKYSALFHKPNAGARRTLFNSKGKLLEASPLKSVDTTPNTKISPIQSVETPPTVRSSSTEELASSLALASRDWALQSRDEARCNVKDRDVEIQSLRRELALSEKMRLALVCGLKSGQAVAQKTPSPHRAGKGSTERAVTLVEVQVCTKSYDTLEKFSECLQHNITQMRKWTTPAHYHINEQMDDTMYITPSRKTLVHRGYCCDAGGEPPENHAWGCAGHCRTSPHVAASIEARSHAPSSRVQSTGRSSRTARAHSTQGGRARQGLTMPSLLTRMQITIPGSAGDIYMV